MNNNTNVLIFPCGSGIGLEICQSLYQIRNIRLIGCTSVINNCNDNSPNQSIEYLNAYYNDLPLISDDMLIIKINEIIEKENIHFIFPAYDDAIVFFSKNIKLFNTNILCGNPEITNICRSKSQTYHKLKDHILVPKMFNINNKLDYPVFVKPDCGQGSHGVMKIYNNSELISHCDSIKDPIILEYLPGSEYTVDCFSDRDFGLQFSGCRERLRTINGISVATKYSDIPEIHGIATKINNCLHMYGTWFFQVKYSKNNELCLLEIAPRIAGCMAYYRGLGINFPLLSIYESMRKPIQIIKNIIPNNLQMVKIYRNFYINPFKYENVYIDLDDTLIQNDNINTQLIKFIYQCINKKISCFLITRSKYSPLEILNKYKISKEIFDEIIHITDNKKKSEFIKNPLKSLFIDDSFSERKDVNEIGSYVIDSSSLEFIINF
jgi:hypothetical protein